MIKINYRRRLAIIISIVIYCFGVCGSRSLIELLSEF
jgi:hypothetical protein